MVPILHYPTLHFFPLTSLRPLHFPLPFKHPPRAPMPESKACNPEVWAQLIKQNALNHMGLQGAPCSHICTNISRLTNSPDCSQMCFGENKGFKNTCYLSFFSDSVSVNSPFLPLHVLEPVLLTSLTHNFSTVHHSSLFLLLLIFF